MLGIMGIILGYGIYQPACYAAVKQFTNEKTSAMGYAMLYAIMNLGGFLPGIIAPPIRKAFATYRSAGNAGSVVGLCWFNGIWELLLLL
ncbi:MAG: hypothetical protein MZV64_35950 [Ignavibacteriales bacterium]|nr:hypothetical protein [Ignavibacteriales bacterium]